MQYLIKLVVSAVLIVLISEIAKRSGFWGAVLASIPLTSILAFVFLYEETKDLSKITDLSFYIFWLVIPSLALFLVLNLCIKKGMTFYPSLGVSMASTIILYFAMSFGLKKFGVL